jgi:hypothetical protein
MQVIEAQSCWSWRLTITCISTKVGRLPVDTDQAAAHTDHHVRSRQGVCLISNGVSGGWVSGPVAWIFLNAAEPDF